MEAALEEATRRFIEKHPRSRKLHEDALRSLPGGNTRSALYTTPFPISMVRGEGYKLYDEDGLEWVHYFAFFIDL